MKATIAARLCEIEIDIRGDKADNLSDWLWDFDARPLVNSDYDRKDVVAKSAHTGFGKKLYFFSPGTKKSINKIAKNKSKTKIKKRKTIRFKSRYVFTR